MSSQRRRKGQLWLLAAQREAPEHGGLRTGEGACLVLRMFVMRSTAKDPLVGPPPQPCWLCHSCSTAESVCSKHGQAAKSVESKRSLHIQGCGHQQSTDASAFGSVTLHTPSRV